MNATERISKSRHDYIAKYKTEPDVLFIDFYIYSMLQPRGFHYDFEEVVIVHGGECVRFAEKADLAIATDRYNRDSRWETYEVTKYKMPVSSIADNHTDGKDKPKPLEPTALQTIVFSSEEIKTGMRNAWSH